MIKSLKKLTKGLILAVGTLVVVAALGLGGAGIYYKNDAIRVYTGLREQVLNITVNVKQTIDDSTKIIGDVFKNGNASITEVQNYIDELKRQADNLSPAQKKALLDKIDEIEKALENVKKQLNSESQKNLENAVKEYTDVVAGVATQIETYANDLDPPKFTATYDAVTISMTAVSAAILGVIIITTILQFTFYKNIDGVSVRRTNAKKDITKHIEKIRKKYPNL